MWQPNALSPEGARYLAIVKALENDIAEGVATDGMALAPQRELAHQLGLSVGTVVRAYAIAKQRGLVTGEVGRGTFVDAGKARADAPHFGDGAGHPAGAMPGTIDLSVNIAPPLLEADRIGNALKAVAGHADLSQMLRYGTHIGPERQRQTLAQWIASTSHGAFQPNAAQIAICTGAQQALSAICSRLRPGQTLLTESTTFPGIKSIAGISGLQIRGVAMDDCGMCPNALEDAITQTGAPIVYLMPTLHNPTGITMPSERREAILSVIARHNTLVIEDDVYGFLKPEAPPPLAASLPEKVCYVSSFSKSVAPGMRVGYCAVPSHIAREIEAALRAACWMSPPLMAEVICGLIRQDQMRPIVNSRIAAAKQRLETAHRCLAEPFPDLDWTTPRYHLWLPQPDAALAERFVRQARDAGVLLSAPDSVAADKSAPPGVRVCLGSAADAGTLETALRRLPVLDPDGASGLNLLSSV